MFDIWNEPSVIAESQYEKANYRIENKRVRGYCYIFCSSNHIWFPNEKVYFEKMVADDRYEWAHIPCNKADKTIYIRNIYKSWYVTGINDRISNMNQLILFLKHETDGYETVTIGSSSGGYLAALYAAPFPQFDFGVYISICRIGPIFHHAFCRK